MEQTPLRPPPTHPQQKVRRPHRFRRPLPLQHHHPPFTLKQPPLSLSLFRQPQPPSSCLPLPSQLPLHLLLPFLLSCPKGICCFCCRFFLPTHLLVMSVSPQDRLFVLTGAGIS